MIRTKHEIAALLRAARPERDVDTDLVHDVLCIVADDLESEGASYWEAGADLRRIADVLRGKREP